MYALTSFVLSVLAGTLHVVKGGPCLTTSGNRPNKACQFPFEYKERIYSRCTLVDFNEPWCSTQVDENGKHVEGEWGTCDDSCPSDDTSVPLMYGRDNIALKDVCGELPSTSFIHNGRATTIEKHPWHAVVRHEDTGDNCGGVLIDSQHVLTAAHCFASASRNYYVALGQTTFEGPEASVFGVSFSHVHPWFHNGSVDAFNGDIAIIELDQPVTFSARIRPICMPEASITDKIFQDITRATVVGFGLTESGRTPAVLTEAEVTLLDFRSCREFWRKVRADEVCGGGKKDEAGVCRGDSGGSMVVRDRNKHYLIGLTSWGRRDCSPDAPAVFVSIPLYIKWIREISNPEPPKAPGDGEDLPQASHDCHRTKDPVNWEGNNWALGCDFDTKDFSSKQTTGEECGQTCVDTPGCTHFAWAHGTCRLKAGDISKTEAFVPTYQSTGMVCGVIVERSGLGPVEWNGQNWALGCDFCSKALSNERTPAERCGPTCAETYGCTHFTWTDYEGGTCWMKTGKISKGDAFRTRDESAVCGVHSDPCLRTDEASRYLINDEPILWNGNNWAFGCDFLGNDLANEKTTGETCGPTCVETPGCTHFTWNQQTGTCWMKKGDVTKMDAVSIGDICVVCGVL